MKLLTLLYVFCLFYVFIPGNVFKLPIKTSKMNIILIHALLFSVILSCTYGLVENVRVLEGMNHDDKKKIPDKNQLESDLKQKEAQRKLETNKNEDEKRKENKERDIKNKERDIRHFDKQMQEDSHRIQNKERDEKEIKADLRK